MTLSALPSGLGLNVLSPLGDIPHYSLLQLSPASCLHMCAAAPGFTQTFELFSCPGWNPSPHLCQVCSPPPRLSPSDTVFSFYVFILRLWMFYLRVCLCTMCAQCPQRIGMCMHAVGWDIGVPGPGLTNGYWLPQGIGSRSSGRVAGVLNCQNEMNL